jgi:glutaminase
MLVEQHGKAARDAAAGLVSDRIRRAVGCDEEVLSEGGNLNRAMLSFMRHHGNLKAASDRLVRVRPPSDDQ